MLYKIAHILRDKFGFIWDLIELLNSWLFGLRYGGKLAKIENEILLRYGKECGMTVVPIREVKTEELADFFAAQPEDAFTFFKPHGFDVKSLRKLQKSKAFLAYVVLDDNLNANVNLNLNANDNLNDNLSGSNCPVIAGYCFNRSFFIGKGFRGRMVGMDHRGRGLGTLMNRLLNDIGFGVGLRLFETVSKRNIASYRSAMSASDVRIVEEMEDDELYLEILNTARNDK